MIDDVLLNNYLVQETDVRKCPKPGCTYAGILPYEGESRPYLYCNDEL